MFLFELDLLIIYHSKYTLHDSLVLRLVLS
jgi:hypothetical protein